jgi:hypothetical protein
MKNTTHTDSVSRRKILKTSTVAVGGLSVTGVAAANESGVTKQTADVLTQMPGEVDCPDFIEEEDAERGVYAEEGASLRRTENNISFQVQMPTPEPGEYIYPCPSETATDEEGPPEAFSLWVFVFDDPDDEDWTGAFLGGGHPVSGPTLTLSGNVSKQTDPFAGAPLENPKDAEVHLAVAPHGALDSDMMPDQIKTPSGPGPYIWWVGLFDPPS